MAAWQPYLYDERADSTYLIFKHPFTHANHLELLAVPENVLDINVDYTQYSVTDPLDVYLTHAGRKQEITTPIITPGTYEAETYEAEIAPTFTYPQTFGMWEGCLYEDWVMPNASLNGYAAGPPGWHASRVYPFERHGQAYIRFFPSPDSYHDPSYSNEHDAAPAYDVYAAPDEDNLPSLEYIDSGTEADDRSHALDAPAPSVYNANLSHSAIIHQRLAINADKLTVLGITVTRNPGDSIGIDLPGVVNNESIDTVNTAPIAPTSCLTPPLLYDPTQNTPHPELNGTGLESNDDVPASIFDVIETHTAAYGLIDAAAQKLRETEEERLEKLGRDIQKMQEHEKEKRWRKKVVHLKRRENFARKYGHLRLDSSPDPPNDDEQHNGKAVQHAHRPIQEQPERTAGTVGNPVQPPVYAPTPSYATNAYAPPTYYYSPYPVYGYPAGRTWYAPSVTNTGALYPRNFELPQQPPSIAEAAEEDDTSSTCVSEPMDIEASDVVENDSKDGADNITIARDALLEETARLEDHTQDPCQRQPAVDEGADGSTASPMESVVWENEEIKLLLRTLVESLNASVAEVAPSDSPPLPAEMLSVSALGISSPADLPLYVLSKNLGGIRNSYGSSSVIADISAEYRNGAITLFPSIAQSPLVYYNGTSESPLSYLDPVLDNEPTLATFESPHAPPTPPPSLASELNIENDADAEGEPDPEYGPRTAQIESEELEEFRERVHEDIRDIVAVPMAEFKDFLVECIFGLAMNGEVRSFRSGRSK